MNWILLAPDEVSPDGSPIRLEGARFDHVQRVLRATAGDLLRVGILGGKLGRGRVVAMEKDHLRLLVDPSADPETGFRQDPPPKAEVTLLLALPRPKVLRRLISAIASLGIPRIYLLHAYRVDKAYWQSPLLSEESLHRASLLGLQQAGDTRLPEIHRRRRFKPFAEDELPTLAEDTKGLALHPVASAPCPRSLPAPLTLAIGPEGGFLPYEVGKLEEAGLEAVSLGSRILRVETVVPWILGRLG